MHACSYAPNLESPTHTAAQRAKRGTSHSMHNVLSCLQGGVSTSSSAGSLSSMVAAPPYMSPASSPSPRLKVQQLPPQPVSDTQRPGSGSAKQTRVEAAAAMVSTPPAMPIRVEAAPARVSTPPAVPSYQAPPARVSTPPAAVPHYQAPAPPQPSYSNYSMPEPPAPRSWTPSKLGSSGGNKLGHSREAH